ncbi:HNH endonuclease [Pendulispora rubella]|uniref:HNH endonuclease n=1 Tax=Pendulispora rubella TaxID=2741070 RepID=A0ABZ2KYR9_9BACT
MNRDYVPLSLQRRVRDRARNRCEYCGISQAFQEATFHVDHVHPRSEEGPTEYENLALACVSCSLRKGARTHALDPATGARVATYNPRHDRWNEHFAVGEDMRIVGRTPSGRATVELLSMNRTLAVAIRVEEARCGRFP